MESLLCTEEWLMIMSPGTDHELQSTNSTYNTSFYSIVEDCEEAFETFLGKEAAYMPQAGYLKHVKSNSSIDKNRSKAIYWLIKSQRRLNLLTETVFCAANYIDRFISLKQCQSWKDWMFELLAVACLSVASKYNGTAIPSFDDLQMGDLMYSFESRVIQRMELTLMKALQWQLGPTTSYSYVELLSRSIDPLHRKLSKELTANVTELLLTVLLDSKFVEFRPCVIVTSAVEYISKELLLTSTKSFSALIPEDQKDECGKCLKMMDQYNLGAGSIYSCPSSPVTVLATQQYNLSDDLISLLKTRKIELNLGWGKKRKRGEEKDECMQHLS